MKNDEDDKYDPQDTYEEMRDEALSDPETRAIYEATKLQIELSLALKKARKKSHLTQEQVAEIMHTHKPVISRLESGDTDIRHFPSLLTLAKFAAAVGYQLKLSLVRIKKHRK
jgi:DNA-binding XRE family transcriptional regulator